MNLSGSGALFLQGNNTYQDATTVASGTRLKIEHQNALGYPGSSTTTTIADGATLDIHFPLNQTIIEDLIIEGEGKGNTGAIDITAVTKTKFVISAKFAERPKSLYRTSMKMKTRRILYSNLDFKDHTFYLG